ncbi:hypothetical protein [Flagellimonas sp.]|uniref:hypothetical protein n=1 Tax=Flagellimonas sp. TaxID=2058762 RepID=UPI003F4A0A1B
MEDEFLPKHCHSIFHQLFLFTSDEDNKLLLLEQILEVGDSKEIPLLEELECMESLEVSKRAYEVKCLLIKRLEEEERANKRLPMSLCFLYEEFDIHPPKSDLDLDIDFELSLEILSEE